MQQNYSIKLKIKYFSIILSFEKFLLPSRFYYIKFIDDRFLLLPYFFALRVEEMRRLKEFNNLLNFTEI